MIKGMLVPMLTLAATTAAGVPPDPPRDALSVALAAAADDLDAKSACLSLDPLPSPPRSMAGQDSLRELEQSSPEAASVVEGERWSAQRTKSALKSVVASGRMGSARESCASTIRIEAPRAAGDKFAVRIAVLNRNAGSRERGYLLVKSGDAYRVVAKTSEHVIVG